MTPEKAVTSETGIPVDPETGIPADLDAQWFRSWCAQAGWEPTPADVETFAERVAIQLEGDDFPELVDHVRLRVAREWERCVPGLAQG